MFIYILEINENATLVFSISFQHGLVDQIFFSLDNCILSNDHSFLILLIDCQYSLFKSTYSTNKFSDSL